MNSLLSILDFVKLGMKFYMKWKKNKPYKEYQSEMDKLDEELEKKDDKLTEKILSDIL